MGWALTQAAGSSPVNLDEAKVHLRVDYDDEDGLIYGMLGSAIELAEAHTRRAFDARAAVYTGDRFPPWDDDHHGPCQVGGGPVAAALAHAIRLPLWPVSAVAAVKYYDAAGVQQTLTETTDYLTFLPRMPALVYPAPGRVWPVTQYGRLGAVEVAFTAGSAGGGPGYEQFRQAVLLTLGYWWTHRGDGDDPTGGGQLTVPVGVGLPAGALRLLGSIGRHPYV